MAKKGLPAAGPEGPDRCPEPSSRESGERPKIRTNPAEHPFRKKSAPMEQFAKETLPVSLEAEMRPS